MGRNVVGYANDVIIIYWYLNVNNPDDPKKRRYLLYVLQTVTLGPSLSIGPLHKHARCQSLLKDIEYTHS